MNIVELQILFQQKIQDINPVFAVEDRPDSFTINNYLNKAVNTYLDKFLNLRSFEERLIVIDQNLDELRDLLKRTETLDYSQSALTTNWDTRAKRYRLPIDCLIPISLTVDVSRQQVLPMAVQKQFAEFTTRRQAEKLISDTSDKVIYPKPVVFFEDQFYLIVVGDAYTIDIDVDQFVYLRKPFVLSHEYSTYEDETEILISGIVPVGSFFRSLTPLTYGGIDYDAGVKIEKLVGVNYVYPIDEPCKIGYPYGITDTPDFPEFVHNRLVEIAVQLFIDEAKLKLVPKQNTK